ncbi:DEAD/DEAH box helicase [Candidatus Pseudomonas adelgestsugas]|uniref:RNA helicase n=1 Tax=Candidatus Pseudomonas adelgestsugas TaxID=1302376 RepID=A0ABX5R9N5_9PSED|nr:DEAD/DEAH box helicase [Candidatus Pseudomonas adelgestsugas]QAX82003.1 ATP-dependent RNA helicase DeaD [Candidatus Pseudomonas adelgestsugas]
MTQETSGFAAFNLNQNILAAVAATGYEEPSAIQRQSIPIIMVGQDMIGQAQTGTGKTAAFALPILHCINPIKREPQALILAPTRELALQVATSFETYAKQMPGVTVVAVYGGSPMGPQLKAIRNGAQVVVATPGRLCDHLRRDEKALLTVNHLVLDEADEMLKLGFMDDLEIIFKALPPNRQTVLFSATLPQSIRAIAERHLRDPRHVKIHTKTQTVTAIKQAYLLVHADQKTSVVLSLLEVEDFDALIMFVRTKQATLDLASILESKGYKAAALNGDIAQSQRERVIDSLKDGRLDIVVATDVAARGLDVPRITHVLNVDMPYDPESYVHRIGRTGRAGREGRALLLVIPRERRMLQVIERVTGQKVTEIRLPDSQAILDARIKKLTNSLSPLVADAESTYGSLLDCLTADINCTLRAMAAALLRIATNGQALNLDAIEKERRPMAPTNILRSDRLERSSVRLDRCNRERRFPVPLAKGHVRCRIALGARDGIVAKNLLGAILNDGRLAHDAIGRIQIRDNFSLVELPEDGLEALLTKLKDTRIAGKQLKLRRYRED